MIDEHEKVKYLCLDCWELLCTECSGYHTKIKLTRRHIMKNIKDLTEDDIIQHKKQIMSKCLLHTSHPIELYCTKCKDLACTICFAMSHATHGCIDIHEADKTFIKQICGLLDNLKACCELCGKDLLVISKRILMSEIQNAEIESLIVQLCNDLKAELKLAYEKLMMKVEKDEVLILESISKRNSIKMSELKDKRQKL